MKSRAEMEANKLKGEAKMVEQTVNELIDAKDAEEHGGNRYKMAMLSRASFVLHDITNGHEISAENLARYDAAVDCYDPKIRKSRGGFHIPFNNPWNKSESLIKNRVEPLVASCPASKNSAQYQAHYFNAMTQTLFADVSEGRYFKAKSVLEGGASDESQLKFALLDAAQNLLADDTPENRQGYIRAKSAYMTKANTTLARATNEDTIKLIDRVDAWCDKKAELDKSQPAKEAYQEIKQSSSGTNVFRPKPI